MKVLPGCTYGRKTTSYQNIGRAQLIKKLKEMERKLLVELYHTSTTISSR